MITVIGETLVDLIEKEPDADVAHPGGSPANVAVALSRLGVTTSLLTQFGDDPYGRMLQAHLRDNGVRLEPGSLLEGAPTSVARTSLDQNGQPRYAFDISWRRFGGLPALGQLGQVDCVHTGSIATVLPPGADDVLELVRAARSTTMVSYDPNCRPSLLADRHATLRRVTELVASSDVVKVSLEDLAWLYPERPYAEVGRDWLAAGAALVVVTLGDQGAWAASRRDEISIDARPVEVVDAVGAGDAFTAGLLTALRDSGLLGAAHRAGLRQVAGAPLRAILERAALVAALTCGRRGADPPTLAEVEAAQKMVG